ncbi:MAG: DUF6440 family protein [Butyricicoccus sp.]
MKSQNNRFMVLHKEGSVLKDEALRQILVDRETGVQYLFLHSGYAGGLTPLLDAEGKPLLAKNIREDSYATV